MVGALLEQSYSHIIQAQGGSRSLKSLTHMHQPEPAKPKSMSLVGDLSVSAERDRKTPINACK